MVKGKGFTKRYATNNSTASPTRNDEKRCDEIHRFASLKLLVKTEKIRETIIKQIPYKFRSMLKDVKIIY